MFWPPKMSHSLFKTVVQVSHHQRWKTCVKMDGKTNFSRRPKQFNQSINQFNSNLAAREPDSKWYALEIIDRNSIRKFDGLTWLTPIPLFYDRSTPLYMYKRCQSMHGEQLSMTGVDENNPVHGLAPWNRCVLRHSVHVRHPHIQHQYQLYN